MRKTSGILIKLSGKNNVITQSPVLWSGLHNIRYYSSHLHLMLWKPWMLCWLLCFEESLCQILRCNVFRPCHSFCHIIRWLAVLVWTSTVSRWGSLGKTTRSAIVVAFLHQSNKVNPFFLLWCGLFVFIICFTRTPVPYVILMEIIEVNLLTPTMTESRKHRNNFWCPNTLIESMGH